MRRNLEKEAFWTFLEHKSEEFDKVPKTLLEVPGDGVKEDLTPSTLAKPERV